VVEFVREPSFDEAIINMGHFEIGNLQLKEPASIPFAFSDVFQVPAKEQKAPE
jgi:hypothetical protein